MPDNDVIKGKAKQVEGRVQAAYGELANSPSQNIKGHAKQVEGKLQEQVGRVKDALKEENREAA